MTNRADREQNLRSERGAVLYMVALMMVVFLGVAAMAIDYGIWFTARSEAQRAAEAGAHAGASILMLSAGDEAGARAEAELFAERNTVRGVVHDVFQDQDIDVILDSQKVRVRVQRSAERGNPLATLFARAMGIDEVDIGAAAAAQVWPGVASECILPFAIPDLWEIPDPGGGYRYAEIGDYYDYDRGDYYVPAAYPVGGEWTGYGVDKVGWLIQLTTANPGESPQPGNYYSIRLPGSKGGQDYKNSILNCWEPEGVGAEYELGDFVIKEPGNMIGPGQQAFRDIFSDPDEQGIVWDDAAGCPVKAGACVGAESRRVRPIVMFDPQEWPNIDNGANPVPITAFGACFSTIGMGATRSGFASCATRAYRRLRIRILGAAAAYYRVLRVLRIVDEQRT